MRTYDYEIKEYINNQISINKNNWSNKRKSNFGNDFQEQVKQFFLKNKSKLGISTVDSNTNPNCNKADITITYTNNSYEVFEVKSFKNTSLSSLTICNSPELINDRNVILINYTVENSIISVKNVIRTQIFRLVTINKSGFYEGCIKCNRDTGKKVMGRNYNDFIKSSDEDDYTLEELTNPELIRKTILYYSASKLVDTSYDFTNEEILSAIDHFKKIKNK